MAIYGHLCPYRNVWPEALHCCFTRTTLFTKVKLAYSMVVMVFSQLCLVIEIR